jgi:hypothetical protein
VEAFVDLFNILFKNLDSLPKAVYKKLQSEEAVLFRDHHTQCLQVSTRTYYEV